MIWWKCTPFQSREGKPDRGFQSALCIERLANVWGRISFVLTSMGCVRIWEDSLLILFGNLNSQIAEMFRGPCQTFWIMSDWISHSKSQITDASFKNSCISVLSALGLLLAYHRQVLRPFEAHNAQIWVTCTYKTGIRRAQTLCPYELWGQTLTAGWNKCDHERLRE